MMNKIFKFFFSTTGNAKQVAQYTSLSILNSLLLLSYPLFSGLLINTVVYTQNFRLLLFYSGAIAGTSLLRLLISYALNLKFNRIYIQSTHKIKKYAVDHIFDCNVSKTDNLDTANYAQRISQDAGVIVEFSISTIVGIITTSITIVIAVTIMLIISPIITLITLIIICVYILLYIYLKKPLHDRGKQSREAQAAYFSRMYEQLSYNKFVKAHSLKDFFLTRFETEFGKYRHAFMNHQKVFVLFNSLDTAVITIAQVTLYIIGGYSVMRNILMIGSFIILSNFFTRLINSASYFFALGAAYQNALVSYSRICETLAWEKEIGGETIIEKVDSITLKDVSFRYDEKNVLNNVNIKFEKGRIYNLTGSNGSGKSTLIQLILGLYPALSGVIEVNNIPLDNIDFSHFRKTQIAYIEQEPVLFPDTVENNVWLDYEKYEEKLSAIKRIGMVDFIDSQKDGWQSVIGTRNNNYSGGEKQRLALARLFLKDSNIMIFDEPTSALDTETIKRLVSLMEEMKRDKIIILITHDNRLADLCDEEIEMESN